MGLDFKEYQARCLDTVKPNVWKWGWLYPLLGIGGEGGEILEKFKKIIRDKVDIDTMLTPGELLCAANIMDEEDKVALEKEVGDELWYLAYLCTQLGIDLETVAQKNLDKLADRKERGVIGGSGDNR
jgi:NTP pyrophosphatase (non-canonical NTP hydrolase)